MATRFFTRFLGPLFSCGLLFAATGCGDDDSGGSTSASVPNQCRADIDSLAGQCDENSGAAQFAELAKAFCGTLENTTECQAKYTAYKDCITEYDVDCDTGFPADDGACDEQYAPFQPSFGGDDPSGECVKD